MADKPANEPDPKPGQELAKQPSPATAPGSAEALRSVFGETDVDVFCSFDPRTPEGMSLLDRCAEAPDAKLRDMVNLKLNLVHVYAHQVEIPNQVTGEIVPCLRTCLVDTEGKVFACVSNGVKKAIVRLAMQHGLPPWKNGIPVKVVLKTIAAGRNWLTILNDQPTVEGGKKK